MALPKPLSKEQAPEDIQPIYEQLQEKFGRMPNIFGVMAHRPKVLQNFLPFYGAVLQGGKIEAKYKELAYLKASTVNGCQY